jgi:MoxR-like ATPase
MKHQYIYYGTKCNAQELENFLAYTLETNERNEQLGRKKTPLCIWGEHGIGKTETVERFAKANGYEWAYVAPAQFEEMGDLTGMPHISNNEKGEEITRLAIPEWVPQTEGKGILLIDDVNRADDRILRGIMQLLQNYELVSWKIPKGWHIVLTANPDGGDYSVTPMDFAMLTRMRHITLTFDAKTWALWAEKNGVDERGISFVLTYPELVSGERTTPRTLVQFFDSIQEIKDLKKDLALVKMLADSTLDSNTVTAFIAFLNNDLSKIISPEDILTSKKFDKEIYDKIKLLVQQEVKRVDILSVITTRLVNYILLNQDRIKKEHIENIKNFLKMDFIPNDIRLLMSRDLASANAEIKKVFADAELSKILLSY